MKTVKLFFIFLTVLLTNYVSAQNSDDGVKIDSAKIYVVIKNDGTEFAGKILSYDAREVLIETDKLGQIIIPKHEIKEIRELQPGEVGKGGEYEPVEVFATRYFITTNGLPIKKGESYIQWNLYGPDFQFGIRKNFGLGIMTSWVGMPIIGSAKYSIELDTNINLALGTLLGTGSWAKPDFGIALPFVAFTFGNRRSNITFSGGYGAVFGIGESDGRALLSVAGMTKVGKKVSLVFDSFIAPATVDGFALLIPGIRWQTESNKAFQFGFGGLITDGELVPVPIPLVQWYRKL